MNRPRARRTIRFVAWASLVVPSLAAVSCRDVVTDDVTDAEAALCDTFDACAFEGDACRWIERFFAEEEDPTFADYLAYYQTWDCGKGCGSVDICLDFPTLCGGTDSACEASFECCEASSGAASCQSGRCCYDVGVVCQGPEDCCPLTNGTPVGCFARQEGALETCGGAEPCGLRDAECVDDDDCCGESSVCVGGTCAVDVCVERGAPCKGDETCCEGGDECLSNGTCGPRGNSCEGVNEPPCCAKANQRCTIGGDALPCCDGQTCEETLTGDFLCGGQICESEEECRECGPLGSDCATDGDCCPNGGDDVRCLGVGSSEDSSQRLCLAATCRLEVGAPCSAELTCCAGLKCLPAGEGEGTTCQEPCGATECHDVRSFGPPIDPDELGTEACNPEIEDESQRECVEMICEADPFCCCVLWKEECVHLALICMQSSSNAATGGDDLSGP